MRSLTAAFTEGSSSDIPSSPIRRKDAIQALERSKVFTPRRLIKVIRHIQKNTYVADTYMSIDGEELRGEYVRAELEDL